MTEPPLAIAPVVGRALTEFGRMLGWVAALSALCVLVPEALDRAFRAVRFRGLAADLAVVGSAVGLWAVQLAAATSRALSSLRGERRPWHATLGTAARRLPPIVLAVALCVAAVVAGVAVLVAPGLVALASLAVAPVAAVDERGGPLRALRRSLELTRGHRGRVLGALAVLGAVAGAGILAAWSALVILDVEGPTVGPLAAIYAFVLFASIPAVGAAVVYETLRGAREAPRQAELARVFD